ncbi:hypothetical protein WDU94_011522 [Cyamophila willieti]
MDFDENFLQEVTQEVKETTGNKRGRKPGRKSISDKVDIKAKLAERSRQSARECRARKKLRYQYLEELVSDREKAVFILKEELEKLHLWSHELAEGNIPDGFEYILEEFGGVKLEANDGI